MRTTFKNKKYTSKKLQKLHDDLVEYLEGKNEERKKEKKGPLCYILLIFFLVISIGFLILSFFLL